MREKRKVGRPVTVRGERSVTIRLPNDLLDAVEAWAPTASKSEAIRRLIERGLPPSLRPGEPDLKALKRAMADAHPDRGGSSAGFIAARKQYVTAMKALAAPAARSRKR